MTLHLTSGTAVTVAANNRRHTPLGIIIGAVVGGVILLLLIVVVFCYIRARKRRATRGTKLRETGAGEMDEEAKPMVAQQQEMVGVPRPLVMQPGGTYLPPQAETMYAGSGYEAQVPYREGAVEAGHRGTDFYRNQ